VVVVVVVVVVVPRAPWKSRAGQRRGRPPWSLGRVWMVQVVVAVAVAAAVAVVPALLVAVLVASGLVPPRQLVPGPGPGMGTVRWPPPSRRCARKLSPRWRHLRW
jgi:hypothetical protein